MRALRNEVRIIAGRWRGRRLRFPPAGQIRPTPDRVRETLFNWLQGSLDGARCLDLFSGSGALAFEALSRGADSAVLVDRDPAVVTYLREAIATLGAVGAEVQCLGATSFLRGSGRRFDLVFLDPPFGDDTLAPLLEALIESQRLAARAWVYIEHAARTDPPPLPPGLAIWRSKRAGEVSYHLLRWEGG
ncbi:MAG: 16S rRNA (guanine(966)-N(2))-methyltransferase RsmD [Immundisolibacter sp.]|uniref:16S rRNA (guanine(966)-N(2))-methyltransferase RsmD n=1 Tax=Immundisolibacter sp. TaxID=1934948 RepID=UPI003EE1FF95